MVPAPDFGTGWVTWWDGGMVLKQCLLLPQLPPCESAGFGAQKGAGCLPAFQLLAGMTKVPFQIWIETNRVTARYN